ncbi:MAG: CRISPR system precrRNA processing endoribonuclease RAMP protein Cas6 [Syntrophomonadales bacterium]|jgi:CRISPR-associated endoribonuclease Cas6
MFRQIRIRFDFENNARPQHYWAYDLYSALIEKMSPDLAVGLHNDGLKPVNQYLILPGRHDGVTGSLTWVINLLGEESIDELFPLIASLDSMHLKHYSTNLRVTELTAGPIIQEKDFVAGHLLNGQNGGGLRLQFLSPASFKSNEEYQIFPSVEWIIKSSVQKWNAYSRETVIDDPEALEQLITHSCISRYSLKSYHYRFKGIKIPGFIGYVNLEVRGPQPMVRLYNMLIGFLAYSGVGIKCSLGMGGCAVEQLHGQRITE